jgi:hypothetical protein
MFDEDDPVLGRLREVALSLPGAALKVSHGRPAFFTTKVFAYYGGSQRVEGEWVAHDHAVLVLPDEADRPGLLEDPRTWVPAYLGPSGWLGVDLVPVHGRGVRAEVAELLDASYRLTAAARLVAALDGRAR